MPTDDQMNIHERYKYLRLMRPPYHSAHRSERGRMLDTMERLTGLARKTLIRQLGRDLKRHPRRRERGVTYGREVEAALRVIAESYDYLCAERLTPNLVAMAEHLAVHHELVLCDELRTQLAQISLSTVYRRLQRFRQDEPRLPCAKRGPANEIARTIPMRRIAWDEHQPGHFEADLVHHSGPSSAGQYVHTLQLVDVATGWSERAAVLGRSYLVMEDGFRRCQARLPFAILELHPDNGAEFLNDLLVRFWKDAKIPHLSRSRPYQKNDNRFVEQKNRSLVRDYLGEGRLDSVRQTNQLNQLYDRMWLYYNFFQPVLRLAEKVIVDDGDRHRIKRRFDLPQTPFERLCARGVLADDQRQTLERLRQQTNPRQLRQDIYDRIDQLMRTPGAKPGQTEDVRRTLWPAGWWKPLPRGVPRGTPPSLAAPHSPGKPAVPAAPG